MNAWQFISSEKINSNLGPGNRGDITAFLSLVVPVFPNSSQKILDVGCNSAWIAHLFEHYFGIDTDSKSIEVAKAFWGGIGRWSEEELNNRLRQVSASLDWPPDLIGFDGIILRDVLEHVGDPIKFIKCVASRLKPGGWIFISAPDSQRWVWNDPTHVRPFPLKAQRWLAQLVGAKIVREGYESVAPGTQKLARIFNGRSPFFLRWLSRLRWWPRNAITLLQLPELPTQEKICLEF